MSEVIGSETPTDAPKYELTGNDASRYAEYAHRAVSAYVDVTISLAIKGLPPRSIEIMESVMDAIPKPFVANFKRDYLASAITEELLESQNVLLENRTKWDTKLWVSLKAAVKSAQTKFEAECEAVAVDPNIKIYAERFFASYFRTIERVIGPLGPDYVRCHGCRPYNGREIAGAGMCIIPSWAFDGCKLCREFGNGHGSVERKYYTSDAVCADGTVFKAPNAACIECNDSGTVKRYIRVKHPKRHERSDGMNGEEPIVSLPCFGCRGREGYRLHNEVEHHFKSQLPAYPSNLRFESAEDALAWTAPAMH